MSEMLNIYLQLQCHSVESSFNQMSEMLNILSITMSEMSKMRSTTPLTQIGFLLHDAKGRPKILIFINRYYRFNKLLLSCVGQWPLQSRNERYFFRTTTVLLVGSILIPKLIALYEYLGDIRGIIQCLPMLSLHFRSVVKFINSIVKANTMKKLTVNIKETWTVKTADFEQALLKRYAERGKLISILYAAYIYSVLYTCLSLPIIPIVLDIYAPLNESRKKMHLFEAEYFVDEDENYLYLLLHAYMTMPISLGIFVAYDAMFAVYVQHSCCIFAILGVRLESLEKCTSRRDLPANAESVVDRDDESYAYIVDCIEIHKEAVEYAKLLESSGTECYVFVVGISMLAITVTGFMTVKNLDDPSEALRYGTTAFGEVLHMFYLCWQGHTLAEHSEHIFINAYNVDWYDLSPSSKKLLFFIMMRSLEPCKLTAGKVFILSMESYATALKTSMSYFTVLLSMQ